MHRHRPHQPLDCRALGLALPKYFGLKMPETREELTDLVEHISDGGMPG